MEVIKSDEENNEENDFEIVFEMTQKILYCPVFNTYCFVADLIPIFDVISHPIQLMTTLVQIGYEPLPPKLGKSLFGRTQLQLPGFFSYMKYVIKTDGFFGIYRGLKYNIAYSTVLQFVAINVDHYQKDNYCPSLKGENAKYSNTNNLFKGIACDLITKITALTIAYPLHLIMVRSIAQFIGRETHYDSLSNAIVDIYHTGGIVGFYSGFIPFLLGECVLVIFEPCLMFVLKRKFEELGFIALKNSPFLVTTVNMLVRNIFYPFKLVSTVMACNGNNSRSLAASAYTAPDYQNWIECWQTLWARGEIKRGSSLWRRYQPLTSSLMFPIQPIIRPNFKDL